MLISITLAVAAFTPFAQSQAAVFQGAPGQPGDVAVVDVTGQVPFTVPSGLAGVTLLDIDHHGRTRLQRFLSGRARLEQRAGGLAWLSLPAGNGSLWRFSRSEAGGGLTFGLLWIDPVGAVRSVFELPGTGPAGDQEPFSPRLAVSPGGEAVLIATTLDAGGNLIELDLASGTALDRTQSFAPLSFGEAGLALAADWGTAACDDRLLRFDRTGASEAEEVGLGATAPVWHSGQLVHSPSGLFAATVAGSSALSAHVWVLGPSGAAIRATDAEAHVSPAGFLPEHFHGPYLAVSDDGTRVAWRTEGITREAFLAPVPQPAANPVPATHVSSDALYLDTLDEIGEFVFRPLSNLLFLAVGEIEVGQPVIESIDYYHADLTGSSTLALSNLTVSNGLVNPPYLIKSTIDPEDGAYLFDGGEVLFHDQGEGGSGTGQLLMSRPSQVGFTQVLPDVKDLDLVELVGDQAFFVVRRDTGLNDREVWTVPLDGSAGPSLALSMPETNSVLHAAVRSDGFVGFVQQQTSKERAWLLDVQAGTLRKQRRFFYGPTLAFAPSGELLFTVGAAGTLAIQAGLPIVGPPFRLKIPVAPGFLMPGAQN